MASIAPQAMPANEILQMEKIIEFSPDKLKAPFLLRCAALFIDYMLMLAIPITWLAVSTTFGGGRGDVSMSATVWFFGLILWVVNFLLLPLFRGQSLGKMLTGITILKTDGAPVRLGAIFVRNVVGYLVTVLTIGIGFFIAAVNKSGRSLHDYFAGTIVVYARKRRT